MKVLVDTSVWSLAFRREASANHRFVSELRSLISDHRVEIIGPIRQELLSGIKEVKQFDKLMAHMNAFPDLPVVTDDYVVAAKFYNLCRSKGVQGSNTDFLICAVAIRYDLAIFTADKDFQLFKKHLPVVLHR
ncbi:MAG: PIN domain-containing protein [Kiritimatiellae bacterium]|nr:PIN domain-containing protein [Kiritimatiellia bacterium]MDD4735255.1 PIN domain-containing protein [Kiritimatiellia bacterium]